VYFEKKHLINLPDNIFVFLLVFMFLITILYLLFDFLFGFTIKNLIKNAVNVKDMEDFQAHKELFNETKMRFDIGNVKFLIEDSEIVNAYAVATFRKKYVIVTTAMLTHITNSFENTDDRRDALKGLIGHELSHLLNWDFLPNFILLSGQNVSFYVGKVLQLIIGTVISVLRVIPVVGVALSFGMTITYNVLNFSLNFFYRFIIHPIYLLIERYLGRLVEYRSDYQSAQALNWIPMYQSLYALLLLNGNTYHSNFSTHPNTISRVLNIYKVEQNNKNISASFFSKYFGLLLILGITTTITYTAFFQDKLLFEYIKQLDSIGNISKNSIVQMFNNIRFESFFDSIKNEIISLYGICKDYILNVASNYKINTYVLIGGCIGFPILITYILKSIILQVRLSSIKNRVNQTENTAIDVLLFYAIENNDIKSFLKVLKSGANINSTVFQKSLEEFILDTNPKFIKYIKKINKGINNGR